MTEENGSCSPMLERAARSLWLAAASCANKEELWDRLSGPDKQSYFEGARAVLAELRQPTEGMHFAGFRVNQFENRREGGFGCPGVECPVPAPSDWFNEPEQVAAYMAAPKCLIARVKIDPLPAWTAMIDAALAGTLSPTQEMETENGSD